MAEKVLMIALSPTMEEGTIVKWNKQEGDTVDTGDVLCEVETDKATMDYESAQEGTLLKIIVNEGSGAAVEQPIAIIGDKGEDIGDLVTEIESSGTAGKSTAGDQDEKGSDNNKTEPERNDYDRPSPPPQRSDDRIIASPLAKKIASQKGLDLSAISGSGPGGRIIKADVDNLSSGNVQSESGSGTPAFSAPAGKDTVVPLNQKRKIIAKRLGESKYSAPHYYLKVSVETDALVSGRKSANTGRDTKLSLNAFFIKLAAETLKKHRYVNATWRGDDILLFGSIDIGLAVALEDGLITPVVRNCCNKSISAIDAELKVLIKKAQEGKLQPDEYTNATFTISNLGSFGIEEFTAIINPPGSAILAVGATVKTPVVQADDSIAVKNIMKLSLSCDHRVIDGKVGAEFLADLKRAMEDPLQALV